MYRYLSTYLSHLLSLVPGGSKNTVDQMWWDVVLLACVTLPVDEERRIKDRPAISLTHHGIMRLSLSPFLNDILFVRLTNLFNGLL